MVKLKICRNCGFKMEKILSFAPDGNVKFFRCSNLKCSAESRHEKINSKDLRFGEYDNNIQKSEVRGDDRRANKRHL